MRRKSEAPQRIQTHTEIAPKTSVRAIAQRLGVSPATVSLALGGRRPTGFVSAATRKQVWDAALEMGYPMERLRAQRPLLDRVAVFMVAGPNPVYSETALQLCSVLNRDRIQVLTHLTQSHTEAYEIAAGLGKRHEADGAIFLGSRDTLPPPLDIPCVFVGEIPPGAHVWQARADNEGGGRAVGEYLWSLGHRTVGLLAPPHPSPVWPCRLEGLSAFWAEQGKQPSASRLPQMDIREDSEAQIHEALSRVLKNNQNSSDPITALFCFNDWTAGMVIKALRSLGVRVPQDISVVGFDDSVYAGLLDPPLTTIHNPFGTLGTTAAQLLLEQAEAPNAEPRVAVIPCRLVLRQSCARPRT